MDVDEPEDRGASDAAGAEDGVSDRFLEVETCVRVVLDFLQSKCFTATEKALRTELELLLQSKQSQGDMDKLLLDRNLYTSDLEKLLNLQMPKRDDDKSRDLADATPVSSLASTLDPSEANLAAGSCAQAVEARQQANPKSMHRKKLRLYELRAVTDEDAYRMRKQRAKFANSKVVFHDGAELTPEKAQDLAHISLPLIYNPHLNGLEDSSELPLKLGMVIAQRYRVVAHIGKGSFSRVVQCLDLQVKLMVSVKVLRNDKDCIDQGLGEMRLLARLSSGDPNGEQHIVRLLDYFYYKEHLLIVSELLRDSLFNFYRYLLATEPDGLASYFTPETLCILSRQLLSACHFLHERSITHCDLKPENVCLVSASRRIFKIIDLGSAVLSHDYHNSYVQSRWYRAPEVMLGLKWGHKVDVWGVGCILAELCIGQPIFYGSTVEAVLAAQEACLGPIPDHMRAASSVAPMYFTPGGQLFTSDPPNTPPGWYVISSVKTRLVDVLRVDESLAAFIGRLLRLDHAERPTAEEAKSDPWVIECFGTALYTENTMTPAQRITTNLTQFYSPVNSRSNSRSDSPVTSQKMSQAQSRDTSPGRERPNKPAHPRTKEGPGLPQEFRLAMQSEASRSHEWRQRLARYTHMVTNTLRDKGSSSKGGESSRSNSARNISEDALSSSQSDLQKLQTTTSQLQIIPPSGSFAQQGKTVQGELSPTKKSQGESLPSVCGRSGSNIMSGSAPHRPKTVQR